MNKPILHWLSDSVLTTTGYATVTRNILNRLTKDFEISVSGHNCHTNPIASGLKFTDGTTADFTIYGNGREQYCKDVIQDRIKTLNADFLGIMLDTFMIYPWVMEMNFHPAKSFFYFPSDGGENLPQGCDGVLQKMDFIIAYSKFAQAQAKQVHNLDSYYIPCGVDETLFYQVSKEEKESFKANMTVRTVNGTLIKGVLRDKFVVGTVARNQSRKALDRTVKAFAKFAKDKPDTMLYMHCDPLDGAAPFDIRYLISRYKIENRVVFSPIRYFENFDYKNMNKVFNSFDIFALTTTGEGWGLPICEAMAAEVPVVVTDYTTTKEIVMDNYQSGIAVPLIDEITGGWCVERGIVDIDKFAESLGLLYKHPKWRKNFGENGRKKVLSEYRWDDIAIQWKKLLLGKLE